MKICAYCGRENADEVITCQECGKEFEPSPPPVDPELKDPRLNLAVVEVFRNTVDAAMFKARLDAAGIEACIPEEYTPQIFWNIIPSPLESVTVRVAAKDLAAAKEILADYSNTAIAASLPVDEKSEGAANPVEQIDEATSRKACVSCGALISETAGFCPKCGWTQPG